MSSSKILSFAHLISPQVHRRNATGFQNQRCKASWAPKPLAGIFFFFFFFFISYGFFFFFICLKKKKKRFGRSHIGYKEFKVTKSSFVWSRSCKQPQLQKSTAPPITLCNYGNWDLYVHLSCKLGRPKGRDAVICSSGSLIWSYCGMTGGLSHVLIFTDLGRERAIFIIGSGYLNVAKCDCFVGCFVRRKARR